jgi:hypothetical protein
LDNYRNPVLGQYALAALYKEPSIEREQTDTESSRTPNRFLGNHIAIADTQDSKVHNRTVSESATGLPKGTGHYLDYILARYGANRKVGKPYYSYSSGSLIRVYSGHLGGSLMSLGCSLYVRSTLEITPSQIMTHHNVFVVDPVKPMHLDG